MSDRSISALVIATGVGAPMRSARPKPIHLLCGRAMTSYVLEALGGAGVTEAVVVTSSDGRVSKRLLEDPPSYRLAFAEQDVNLGQADAALVGMSTFDGLDDADIVVIPGDLPLIEPADLIRLVDAHRSSGAACTLLCARGDSSQLVGGPDGLVPRTWVQRDQRGRVLAVELANEAPEDPSDPENTKPAEVALGVYCFRRELLSPVLRRCLSESLSARVPLTDAVAVVAESGHECHTVTITNPTDALPVDNRLELAEAEAELRRRTNRYWMQMGVTMVDPAHTYVDATVELGTDVTIFPDTILQGATVIGDGCEIGPSTQLDRCRVGDQSRLERTTASLATVGDDCVIGPFAVLEPGAMVADGTKTGPFFHARS